MRCGFAKRDETKMDQSGFTLLEVLAVIVIVGILASIAVPAVGHLIEKAEVDVCEVNRLYHDYLILDGLVHSDVLFLQFLGQFVHTCPVGGNYGFVDGEVVCDLHGDEGEQESEEEDPDDGGVPFL